MAAFGAHEFVEDEGGAEKRPGKNAQKNQFNHLRWIPEIKGRYNRFARGSAQANACGFVSPMFWEAIYLPRPRAIVSAASTGTYNRFWYDSPGPRAGCIGQLNSINFFIPLPKRIPGTINPAIKELRIFSKFFLKKK